MLQANYMPLTLFAIAGMCCFFPNECQDNGDRIEITLNKDKMHFYYNVVVLKGGILTDEKSNKLTEDDIAKSIVSLRDVANERVQINLLISDSSKVSAKNMIDSIVVLQKCIGKDREKYVVNIISKP